MTKFTTLGAAAVFIFLGACTERQQEAARQDASEASREVKEERAELSAEARAARQEYEKKMEARLEKMDRDFDELQRRASNATGEAKAKWQREMAELEDERREARMKYNELKTATGAGWERFKDGVESAFDKVESGYNRMLDAMKTDR
jgi:chromosome segregation ATPase